MDCIDHTLLGEHPAWQLQQQMLKRENQSVSLNSLTDRLAGLLAVDLNPVGHLIRLATRNTTYQKTWNFFNDRGNVVRKSGYEGFSDLESAGAGADIGFSVREDAAISASHEKVLASYQTVLSSQLQRNQNIFIRARQMEDSKVSAVARIFAAGQLVQELSEFFEEFPRAKVSQACARLSIHPRMVERRMHELGMTAVKLKRACMLSQATHQVLWTNRAFDEIAVSCGFTHGAHLSRAVFSATGGMTPSLLRGLARA